jgi:hypothetical protein
MKICVVTLPFNSNYGGILQAYALQSALKKMGHEVATVRRYSTSMPLKLKVFSFARRSILRTLFRKDVVVRTWPTKKENRIISEHTNRFIEANISTTDWIRFECNFGKLRKNGFDAYVVGSDQVWRPKYAPKLSNHFLGFVDKNSNARKIAYAASFGVDKWEFAPNQTKKCSKLLQRFDAVSVREDSGISLCRDYLGVSAVQTLDPTLLLSKEEYTELAGQVKLPGFANKLVIYVLDMSEEKKKIIQKVTGILNLESASIMPDAVFRDAGPKKVKDCIFPPVENWIRGFMDASFVVTDSFHGTVFSILFNKPFLALGNANRGMTRFVSLLKIFGLEERLVLKDSDQLAEIIRTPVDFNRVNNILSAKRNESLQFLKQNLGNQSKPDHPE